MAMMYQHLVDHGLCRDTPFGDRPFETHLGVPPTTGRLASMTRGSVQLSRLGGSENPAAYEVAKLQCIRCR
jgi:hypothetical protein